MGIPHFWREHPPNNGTGLLILGQHYNGSLSGFIHKALAWLFGLGAWSVTFKRPGSGSCAPSRARACRGRRECRGPVGVTISTGGYPSQLVAWGATWVESRKKKNKKHISQADPKMKVSLLDSDRPPKKGSPPEKRSTKSPSSIQKKAGIVTFLNSHSFADMRARFALRLLLALSKIQRPIILEDRPARFWQKRSKKEKVYVYHILVTTLGFAIRLGYEGCYRYGC